MTNLALMMVLIRFNDETW